MSNFEKFKAGESGRGVESLRVDESLTTPPDPYTEGTLLEDMKNAWKFLENPEWQEIMKEADGIGTPATRASIIEELKKDNSLMIEGKKKIRSTDKGRAIIEMLPKALTNPGLTAVMEGQLKKIAEGSLSYNEVMSKQNSMVSTIIEHLKSNKPQYHGETREVRDPSDSIQCSTLGCDFGGSISLREGKLGPFWSCSKGGKSGSCTKKFNDSNGKPVLRTPPAESQEYIEKLPGDSQICKTCKTGLLKTKKVMNEESVAFGKRYLQCSTKGCKSVYEEQAYKLYN